MTTSHTGRSAAMAALANVLDSDNWARKRNAKQQKETTGHRNATAGGSPPNIAIDYDAWPEIGDSSTQPTLPDGTCERCTARWDFGPELLKPVELGPVRELSTRGCPTCKFFAGLFAVEHTAQGATANDGRRRLDNVAQLVEQYPDGYCLELNRTVRARMYKRSYIASENLSQHPSTIGGSPLDPALVTKWLSNCDTCHGEQCRTSFTPETINIKLNLIDVENQCIITATQSDQYIALSYMVGNGKQLKLTTTNSSRLRQTGSLLGEEIPQIVLDAMELTRSINHRFLWIDSLCIVQDDQVTKHDQIMNMHFIYSRAILTVVSASGNSSDHGLPGVIACPRPVVNLTHKRHNDMSLQAQAPSFSELMTSSPYETRGWTFQERILSPRCLYLTNWQAFFTCRLEIQSELPSLEPYRVPPKSRKENNFNPLGVLQTKMTESVPVSSEELLECYAQLVESYSKRSLSFPDDILNAFAGITAALGRIQGTAFACGLPACALEKALFWTPTTTALTPRQLGAPKSSNADTLPSWSWAAWIGPVNYKPVVPSWQTKTISQKLEVQWLDGNSNDAAVISAESAVALVNNPKRKFKHQRALCFRASVTKLSSFNFFDDTRYNLNLYAADAEYPEKWYCGVILDLNIILSQVRNRASCELVRIFSSTGWDSNGPESCNRLEDGRGRSLTLHYTKEWRTVESTFVYVMLINWEGNVAKRLSVGAIHQDAWNAVQTEQKIITLV